MVSRDTERVRNPWEVETLSEEYETHLFFELCPPLPVGSTGPYYAPLDTLTFFVGNFTSLPSTLFGVVSTTPCGLYGPYYLSHDTLTFIGRDFTALPSLFFWRCVHHSLWALLGLSTYHTILSHFLVATTHGSPRMKRACSNLLPLTPINSCKRHNVGFAPHLFTCRSGPLARERSKALVSRDTERGI